METSTEGGAGARITGYVAGRYHDAGVSGVIGFLGIPGTGKTYRMGRVLSRCRRVIVFNTVGAYGDGARQNRLGGFTLVTTPQELVSYVRGRDQVGNLRVLYQPEYNARDHFADVAALVYEMRDVVFAVDEVWNMQTPSWSPEPLTNIFLMGRIRGITLLWTAQRAAKVDKNLTGMSTELYVGTLVRVGDIQAVADEFPIPEEAIASIRTLPRWQFVHAWQDGRWRIE